MSNFLESANTRETSDELMEAIYFVAKGNDEEADRIWQDPSKAEAVLIWERVTKNGQIDSKEFLWGAAGRHWASELGVEG